MRHQSRIAEPVRKVRGPALVAIAAIALAGCASLNQKEDAGAVGTVAGAAATGAVASHSGSTARDAIIDAVVGGSNGMVIGHQMDQQAKALTLAIPGAVVERFGEGIQVTFPSALMYASESDVVRPEGQQTLKNLALSMKTYPETELLIVGHTDGLGTTEHNMDLSSRRASSASRYLSTQGLNSDRIHTTGKGSSERLEPTATESGRQKNTRIEVAIFALAKARTATR